MLQGNNFKGLFAAQNDEALSAVMGKIKASEYSSVVTGTVEGSSTSRAAVDMATREADGKTYESAMLL